MAHCATLLVPGTDCAGKYARQHCHSLSSVHGENSFAGVAREGVFLLYTTTDRTLTCADCNGEFIFTASEQDFFAERQFSEPRRCPACRASRKLSRGGSGILPKRRQQLLQRRVPPAMFEATCASCGRIARVPFQPTGSKPVYCSDCFTSQRQSYR